MVTKINGNGIQFSDNTVQYTASHIKYRNRIINSRMEFDQRNNGALVTYEKTGYPTGKTNGYFVDRFSIQNVRTNGSTITAQQVLDAPSTTNLQYSSKVTNTLGGTSVSTDAIRLFQRIEGLDINDLEWGGLSAKFVSISFWVKSSVTGNYAVRLANGPGNRSYVKEYTINAANTWEKKTFVVAGSTDGIWDTSTGVGIQIDWDLGCGTDRNAPAADVWLPGNYNRLSTSVRLSETTGATFQLTGVQFEKGIIATDLEYIPLTIELFRCERYFSVNHTHYRGYTNTAGGSVGCWIKWRRPLRLPNPEVAPTVYRTAGLSVSNASSISTPNANYLGARYALTATASGYVQEYTGIYKVEAEL